MKGSLALLAVAGVALASPVPQTSSSTCSPDYSGEFTITIVNTTATKRSLEARQLDGTLMLNLAGGILTDQAGRIGYIAANDQFQFDNPVQEGWLSQSGWSVCDDGNLALEDDEIFYQCLSGEFYNLYADTQGGQCNAIHIVVQGAGSAPASSAPAPATGTTSVTQLSDGQPQATSAPVTQISDGQPQASTAPVTQISDGQPQAPAVTQISDGQPQAPKVTQISDGQVQAPTGAPVTQISDGQVQATTGAPVTQISDGQVQATTGAPVTQISDGQVQATTGAPVTQISDGQVQATTGAAIATFTGAAAPRELGGSFALVAGIVGAVAML